MSGEQHGYHGCQMAELKQLKQLPAGPPLPKLQGWASSKDAKRSLREVLGLFVVPGFHPEELL